MMWELTREPGLPIYQSIVKLIMQHIQSGLLLPGQKIPSERALAEKFQVNRSTVVHALDELAAMGIVIRRQGSGTIINDGKWGVYTGPTIDWRDYLMTDNFDVHGTFMEQLMTLRHSSGYIDLVTGDLPLELIPTLELPNITWKEFLKEDAYQDKLGYPPLRQKISTHLAAKTPQFDQPDNLLITSGAQQALFLIIQVLLQKGDAIAVEAPSFLYSLSLFQVAGVRMFGIPMDDEGMRIDALEKSILKNKIRMVFVNPTFQNPTGVQMSLKRRQELVALCNQYQVPIVEDDVFADLYFPETPYIPSLKELDFDNVLYIGSLSKILGSSTKIGWLSAPPAVIGKLSDARQEMDADVSIFPQVLALNAMNNQQYAQKLSRLGRQLSDRLQLFTADLERRAPGLFDYRLPEGGFYLWLELKQHNVTMKNMHALFDAGLLAAPSFLFGIKKPALRLNFARISPDNSLEIADKLAALSNHYWE
ncbi:hypothetical protein CBF27_02745 [Vagococcus acidifermentans]|uniref:HTH gntR-type domain-containing protein n=2 Tax=Vagococcus acidifermentans TaxID=564710 RepID=A0A430B0I4_9ENTE|nr:hypothetical protein CBF27_02745 [Vagococcus acidifermentans]